MSPAEKLLLNLLRMNGTKNPIDAVYCTNFVYLQYSVHKKMFYVSVNNKIEYLSGERLLQLINIHELRLL